MPHIHTQPGQYDFTVSAFITRFNFNEPKVFLHFHKKLNLYMQFGGHVELDETPWQAIQHELKEESGYNMDQLKLLQPKHRLEEFASSDGSFFQPIPLYIRSHRFGKTNHFHTDISFAFITQEEPAQTVAEGESGELRWFSEQDLQTQEKIYPEIVAISIQLLKLDFTNWEQVSLK